MRKLTASSGGSPDIQGFLKPKTSKTTPYTFTSHISVHQEALWNCMCMCSSNARVSRSEKTEAGNWLT